MLEEIMLIILILLVTFFYIRDAIREFKKSYSFFNELHPVGFTKKQRKKIKPRPGKWKYLGKNQNNLHVYERIKWLFDFY